jgi:putative flavoprotein involved in K+ transport
VAAVGYITPEPFDGKRVLIVGGGNLGAQILAELSLSVEVTWLTKRPPRSTVEEITAFLRG